MEVIVLEPIDNFFIASQVNFTDTYALSHERYHFWLFTSGESATPTNDFINER